MNDLEENASPIFRVSASASKRSFEEERKCIMFAEEGQLEQAST